MKSEEVQEIVSCLPRGKTVFHYFRDRYAALLLARAFKEKAQLGQVKRSRFGRLLSKPIIADLLGRCGDGRVTPDLFNTAWAQPAEPYLLGLTSWGIDGKRLTRANYHQTSRPGVNLVLQLNFSSHHERPSSGWIGKADPTHPFVLKDHPVACPDRNTLAWARLDIDLASGEALIEEIQSDWVREVHNLIRTLRCLPSDQVRRRFLTNCYAPIGLKGIREYAAHVLPFHARHWAEAMLSAAIWFLHDEIGVRRIYYHTFDGGNRLKGLSDCPPPRSLYTDLPRRFCFDRTTEPPRLLDQCTDSRVRSAVRSGEIEFHRINL